MHTTFEIRMASIFTTYFVHAILYNYLDTKHLSNISHSAIITKSKAKSKTEVVI